MKKLSLRILVAACSALLLSAPVYAEIDGSIWEVDDATAGNAVPSSVPGTAPVVTFALAGTDINFDSDAGGYTIGGFLASGGATISTGGSHAGDSLEDTIFDIRGTVTVNNGDTFVAGHDDGLTFIIDGNTVISDAGPTGFTGTPGTYTGPSGTFDFELVYGECCGPPGRLQLTELDLSTTPEPSSVVLMSSVMLALGFMLRKRSAKAV